MVIIRRDDNIVSPLGLVWQNKSQKNVTVFQNLTDIAKGLENLILRNLHSKVLSVNF